MTGLRNAGLAAIAATAWFAGVSCTGGAGALTCNDDGDCINAVTESGYARCLTEVERCVEVQCLANDHCDVGNWCNENNNCIPGCASDLDCMAGQACNTDTHACENYGCRSTELDCGLFETCNAATGECVWDGYEHCGSCDPYDFFGTECSPGECLGFEGRPDGEGWCFAPCGSGDSCPRGMECQTITGLGAFCVASCPDLDAAGLLPW